MKLLRQNCCTASLSPSANRDNDLILCVVRVLKQFHFTASLCCRFTDKPLYLNHVAVPKGSFIYVSLYALHMSECLWDDPDKFIPERWLFHSSKDATLPASNAPTYGPVDKAMQYLPFSNGPRSCVAQVRCRVCIACALACLIVLLRPYKCLLFHILFCSV